MRWIKGYTRWLELHWANPAYAGWVIMGLTACFWLAAANTLAGWLYVLSGTCLAVLASAARLPMMLLKQIDLSRSPMYSVSVGETLSLSVTLSGKPKSYAFYLQCQDELPASFAAIPWHTVEFYPQQEQYVWNYGVIPQNRGAYHWDAVHVRTEAPLGLFRCQRRRSLPASVLIYPEIVPLKSCPILDEFSTANALIPELLQLNQLGNDGTTRSVRPYRQGDSRRLIHWRSSAKYNELRTRELEVIAGDSPVIIALDSGDRWTEENFESAIIAAASLFHYGEQHGMAVQLWTAGAGLQQHYVAALETLALISSAETEQTDLPNAPVLWLTESSHSLQSLPPGSISMLWSSPEQGQIETNTKADIVLSSEMNLEQQLQERLARYS